MDSIPNESLSMAPKYKTAFFLVKICLRNYSKSIDKNDIFRYLRNNHQHLECIVSVHNDDQYKTNYRSSTRFELILDTRYMIPKRYKSADIYHWINQMLRLIVGLEQIVPLLNELNEMDAIKDIDYFPEISIEKARPDRAIKKVTERDFEPRLTPHFSSQKNFSENFMIEHWARSAVKKPFDELDPFLRKPGLTKSVAYLRAYFEKKQNILYNKNNKN
jgi:hypothetical protein